MPTRQMNSPILPIRPKPWPSATNISTTDETEKAIGAYTRATDLDPDLADAWFKLGIAYGLVEKAQELEAKTDVNAPDNQPTGKPNSEKAFRRAVEGYKKLLAKRQ